uniref:Uncharacterized protein n=1 Tax=Romanomermis culicivorax TaxID=13658 RepID=A0A915JNQ6_ROMCU
MNIKVLVTDIVNSTRSIDDTESYSFCSKKFLLALKSHYLCSVKIPWEFFLPPFVKTLYE